MLQTRTRPVGGTGASPARRCAYTVLRRVFEDDAYADLALHAEARRARLDTRDRALATQLAFGVVQRRLTLDHLIAQLADRPVERLDPPLRAALRLGLYQLLFLDRVPGYAAVGESVALARRDAPRGAGLVNAVLRRASAEGRDLLDALDDATPERAAVRHSHPEWLVRMWWDELGADRTRTLLAANNAPAESALRANTLVATAEELARSLPVASSPADAIPEGLVLGAPFDAHGSPLWRAGAFMPQSRAAMLVSRVLDPRPGDRVLDLCAAPGGKTTHIAALTRGEGELIAVEANAARARSLEETCRRMRARNVVVEVADARAPHEPVFDRVLVDAPCSGLGTLQTRPDLRWRASPAGIAELVRLQAQILAAGARALAPGGVLVYATCTICAAENERQVDALLAERPDLQADDLGSDYPLWHHPHVPRHLQLLPDRDGTAGFFIARLRRDGG